MGGAQKGYLCPLHFNQQFSLNCGLVFHMLFRCITVSSGAIFYASPMDLHLAPSLMKLKNGAVP